MKIVSPQQAGSALVWRGAQLASVKAMFLLRLLILARLLSPEDFGLMAIAVVAIGLLMTVTDMGIMPALVQRADTEETHYHTAWTIGVLRGAIVTAVVTISAPLVAKAFAQPEAMSIIRVLAFRPLFDAAASIKVAELTRTLCFRSLTCIHVPAAAVELIVSVALANMFGVWALVIGALAGSIATVSMSYAMAPYWPRFSLRIEAIRPLMQYGRWIFMTGLAALAASFVLQMAISRQLGSTELGLYFLAAKLAFLPYAVISEVVSAVAFPLYARLQSDLMRAGRAFRIIFVGMISLLVPVYALMIVFAPSLVENVLGPKWAGAAPLIQLLAFAGTMGAFGDATGPVFRGLGQPDKILAVEVVQSGLVIGLVWYLAGHYGLVGAGLAWLLAIGISQVFSAVFLSRVLQRPFTGLAAPVTYVTLCSIMSAMVALVLDRILAGFSGLIIAAFLAAICTAFLFWICDRRFNIGLAMSLREAFPQIAKIARLSPSQT